MTAESTVPKQFEGHAWQPGQSGNQKGRPKGARHKLGKAFLEAMVEDFDEHGKAAIVRVRKEKPEQYLKVIASMLPKDLNINVSDADKLSDEELIERIRTLDTALRPFLDAPGVADTSGDADKATIN